MHISVESFGDLCKIYADPKIHAFQFSWLVSWYLIQISTYYFLISYARIVGIIAEFFSNNEKHSSNDSTSAEQTYDFAVPMFDGVKGSYLHKRIGRFTTRTLVIASTSYTINIKLT